MINISIENKNLFSAQKIYDDHWEVGIKKLPKLLQRINSKNQGFYTIFDDANFQKEGIKIKQFYTDNSENFTDIVICGIGGSALGLAAIVNALPKKNTPNLHILDNSDPDLIFNCVQKINLKKTLFIIISKSGGTSETISQYLYFSNLLQTELKIKDEELKKNIVIITGKSGFLRDEVIKHKLTHFSVPENIGGRFSVLTAVGLLPAIFMKINIDELIAGAQKMVKLFTDTNPKKNLPFQFALSCYLSDEPIHAFMPYSSRLKQLGAWYTQLLAESTGKEGQGYTVISAVGATDQHSQLQLFSDGPEDKLVIFVKVEKFENNVSITSSKNLSENNKIFENKTFQDLIHAELEGTQKSLQEKKVSNMTLHISEINENTLGQLFLFLQGSTAFIGEMLGINTFDQPGVERSKVITKEILGRSQ
ncbi:TPA: glucose-6-phosphate isomerase [Candidatus Gracilibacteria bacterium]|nr:glucose-6-phosphate isomerase [Candidatus Gracilibacteria bacterium]